MLAEVMSYEAALLAGLAAMGGAMGIVWAKLSATDKRQQQQFDDFKAQQEQELKECRELRSKFIDFLITQTGGNKVQP